MPNSLEFPIERDHSPDELAELINQFATALDKELPLEVLYRWKDPTLLSKEMREKHPVPEAWIKFNQSLTINDRAKVTKIFGFATRSGIETIRELQKIKEKELSQRELIGTKSTIGDQAAHILSKGFAIPNTNGELVK